MAHSDGSATNKECALIGRAVESAFAVNGNRATITNVVAELSKTEDSQAQDLCLLLEKFTSGGQYASFFEGESILATNNPIMSLDLEPIKDLPDLKSVVMLSMILQINEEIYNSPRDIPKMCVIDEAWDLLHSSKIAAKFIEAGYRRAAKHNGGFVAITQSINDYFKNDSSIAVYENSDHQLILAQKQETLDGLLKEERLNLSPYEEKLIRSIHGTHQYKECLLRTPQGSSLVRIVFEPFSRILFSSKAEHVEAVKSLQSQGMTLIEAIEMVARQEYASEY